MDALIIVIVILIIFGILVYLACNYTKISLALSSFSLLFLLGFWVAPLICRLSFSAADLSWLICKENVSIIESIYDYPWMFVTVPFLGLFIGIAYIVITWKVIQWFIHSLKKYKNSKMPLPGENKPL